MSERIPQPPPPPPPPAAETPPADGAPVEAPSAEAPAVQRWPHWADELSRLIAVRPQFVISGNVRDVFLTVSDDAVRHWSLTECLLERLRQHGCECLFVWDPMDGVRIHPEESRDDVASRIDVPLAEAGPTPVAPDELPNWFRAVASAREIFCAFAVDYASRITNGAQGLSNEDFRFFAQSEKIAQETLPLRPPVAGGPAPFNPIVWIANNPRDLPNWFVAGNEGVRALSAALPDRDTRAAMAGSLAARFPDYDDLPEAEREKLVGQFADVTDGITLRSMLSIYTLSREQELPLTKIVDAVRLFKIGLPDNPWQKDYLGEKLKRGEEIIGRRLKGQDTAVKKSLGILVRSVMNLTGAQASSTGSKPRGVLFFAGPTGVGKTELAKALTQLVFGDQEAYRRFDMSEFSQDHTVARLVGAPPGYIGYEAGGELVDAVRERPFSVLLFDEIEKAHPRILDTFLQILDDGRLTDGSGETVYFSEAVIIFTTNLGIYVADETGARVENVNYEMPLEEVKSRVRQAISDHFRFQLQRPELLNRIGDNVVVFDFIRADAASQIFDMMLANVVDRVRRERGVELTFTPEAREYLHDACTSDMSFGGRGIGNCMETALVDPLALALFEKGAEAGPGAEVVVRLTGDDDDPDSQGLDFG